MIRRVIRPYFRIGFYSSIFFGVSSGNQTWLAGKSPLQFDDFPIESHMIYIGKFQSIAVIDYLRVYHHYPIILRVSTSLTTLRFIPLKPHEISSQMRLHDYKFTVNHSKSSRNCWVHVIFMKFSMVFTGLLSIFQIFKPSSWWASWPSNPPPVPSLTAFRSSRTEGGEATGWQGAENDTEKLETFLETKTMGFLSFLYLVPNFCSSNSCKAEWWMLTSWSVAKYLGSSILVPHCQLFGDCELPDNLTGCYWIENHHVNR